MSRNKHFIWYMGTRSQPHNGDHITSKSYAYLYMLMDRVQRGVASSLIPTCNLYYHISLWIRVFSLLSYIIGSNNIKYMISGSFLHKFCFNVVLNIADQQCFSSKFELHHWCDVHIAVWCCLRYTIPSILIFKSYHHEDLLDTKL